MSLTPGEREALRTVAALRDEPEATAAARLVRAGLVTGAALEVPPAGRGGQRSLPQAGGDAPRALWLPPRVCEPGILSLRERYPLDLRAVTSDFATDRLVAEGLAAFSVWRDELDAGHHRDPRVEIAFGVELMRFGRAVEERRRQRR